jgi:hypothetical protein
MIFQTFIFYDVKFDKIILDQPSMDRNINMQTGVSYCIIFCILLKSNQNVFSRYSKINDIILNHHADLRQRNITLNLCRTTRFWRQITWLLLRCFPQERYTLIWNVTFENKWGQSFRVSLYYDCIFFLIVETYERIFSLSGKSARIIHSKKNACFPHIDLRMHNK